jgi:hypothetical protein
MLASQGNRTGRTFYRLFVIGHQARTSHFFISSLAIETPRACSDSAGLVERAGA